MALQEVDFHGTPEGSKLPLPKTGTYMRPAQTERLKGECEKIRKMLSSQMLVARLEDPGAMQQRLKTMEHQIEVQSAPTLTGEQRTLAAREEHELRESILDGMPSYEEMRKAPPGALGKHRRWEALKKSAVLRWKNRRLQLNPENTDPDLCNIETFRPRTSTLGMDNAFIPGTNYNLSPDTEQYRDNWDATFDPVAAKAKERDLEDRLEKLEQMLAAATNGSVTATVKPASRPELAVTMKCGKQLKRKSGARMHIKHCDVWGKDLE